MKVERVVMTSTVSATIYLQPSWLARLFGARLLVCELEYRGAKKWGGEDGLVTWRSKHTGQTLGYMRYGSLLEHALECHPMHDVPIARLIEGFE